MKNIHFVFDKLTIFDRLAYIFCKIVEYAMI